MDNYSYKVILFGKGIYQEIELSEKNENGISIGTTKNCNIRFNREIFFDEFEFYIKPDKDKWKLTCGESIYFVTDGLMKQYALNLEHGKEIKLKYQESNSELMKLSFLIDFDKQENNYDRLIDLEGQSVITIGGKSYCNIQIQDKLVGEDSMSLIKDENEYFLQDSDTKYGIFINGFKMAGKKKIIENMDFFMLDGYGFYLKNDKLYTSIRNGMTVTGLKYQDYRKNSNQMKYPKFQRNTRVMSVVPEETIEVLAPKAKNDPPKKNLLQSLIPALASLGLMVALRGVMGGGGSFILYSVAMMSIGIVTSFIAYIHEGREYRIDMSQRRTEYLKYASECENKIKELREKEYRILEEKYIPLEETVRETLDFDSRLFEKGKTDDDYLVVRIGTGMIEANCLIEYKKQEFKDTEDDLVDYPEKLSEAYRYLQDAPVCIALREVNCIGIVGMRDVLYEMVKNITVDLSVRHFYHDIKFYYMFNEEDYNKFMWLRWLRNVRNEGISIRNFMYNEESRKIILESLYEELSNREGYKAEEITKLTHFVVFVYSAGDLAKHPVSKYLEECKKYGFTFIFFEEYEEFLPKGCDKIIRLQDDYQSGILVDAKDSEKQQKFHYHTISNRTTENLSLKLGCVYVDEVNLESSLTKSISLYELLGIMNVEDLDIASRWSDSKVYESMAAPLGVKSGDEIVCLDLNEKHHGPHGLVAGTTGSGKSEILQSYILSMATLFHPYEVGFVIIDFKGGGMVNQFIDLPHLVGAITNIDGREVDRSLLSIKAELRKRQELFAEYNVNHIDAYIKKYKIGETETALPHLILVVDEFAELKSDQPEFMKELISAARIGRSLGVHLILATQKPSGVVDDQIWSNSKFKLCLKVQNKEDSNEVLKSPLAAEIKEPGRAYLQVGNNEIFELFQSAYSGAGADNSQIGIVKEYVVYDVDLFGKRKIVFNQKNEKKEKKITQLEAIVDYVAKYCRNNDIQKLPGICLPSLEEMINYEFKVPEFEISTDIGVVLGIYDAPEQQLQSEMFVNITQKNIFVIGSSQYGKTNLVEVILKGLAMNYTPVEVNVYILDFASMILKTFEGLSHVGGVITSSEDERLKNFFKMIFEEIAKRKEILSKLGISSFSSYKDAGYLDLPQIVIMVDNLTVLKELYLQDDDSMLIICREGLALGISVVVVNSQISGIGYKYLANFAERIALYCNDSGEYGNLFDHCRMQPKNVPGRGIVDIDKVLYEYQTYLAFEGIKEIERVQEMKAFIEEVNSRYETKAKQIPEIPQVLGKTFVEEQYTYIIEQAYKIMIGLNYATVSPVCFDMLSLGVLGITGKEKSGKGNFLRYILNGLNENRKKAPVEAIIIDDISRKYMSCKELDIVSKYTMDMNAIGEILTDWEETLHLRYEKVAKGDDMVLQNSSLLLLIVQNQDVPDLIQNNDEWLDLYKAITGKYKSMKVCIIFSNIPNSNISYSAPEPLKNLKESKHFVIFDDIASQKILDIPYASMREFKKRIEIGDCYYLKDEDILKVKSVFDKK